MNEPSDPSLPIHFFTLVLNGEPYIRHHVDQFKKLPFPWHWHVMEGVAELKHDTAWSLANGGSIKDELHRQGLSNDGTSEYLDALAAQYPSNITIYRKPTGAFWDGKLEMVNAPLANIRENCLLWQIDADECWSAEQIEGAHLLFRGNPDKEVAFFRCHFYVGPAKVISSYDTYGNHTEYEWLRLWRFVPGSRWIAHEPPTLYRPHALRLKALADGVGALWTRWFRKTPPRIFLRVVKRLFRVLPRDAKAFSQDATKDAGLVFHHFAYALPSQIRFKEIYYGYADALGKWEALQATTETSVRLSDYFDWVTDAAVVAKAPEEGTQLFFQINGGK